MENATFASVDDVEARIGEPVAISDWLTVTQTMIDEFAELTGDRQWIHLDAERARRESPFGTTVAHGFLVLSLLPPLAHGCLSLPTARLSINYGFDRIRFIAPVPSGGAIRATFSPHEVRRTADGVHVAWDVEIAVRDAPKPALAARWLIRLVL